MPDDPAAKMQNTMTEAATGAAQMGKTTMDAGMAKMAEFTKMFSDMKVPGMAAMPDMDAFLSAHRRNMEVLTAANRVALEGAQAVARRHMEIMQQTMSEMTETMRDLSSPDSPQAKAAKQTELMKSSYERAVAHMKELADLIQRANGEALGMLNHRFAEAMDEVKLLAAKAGPTSST
jgi:phasin family protein